MDVQEKARLTKMGADKESFAAQIVERRREEFAALQASTFPVGPSNLNTKGHGTLLCQNLPQVERQRQGWLACVTTIVTKFSFQRLDPTIAFKKSLTDPGNAETTPRVLLHEAQKQRILKLTRTRRSTEAYYVFPQYPGFCWMTATRIKGAHLGT